MKRLSHLLLKVESFTLGIGKDEFDDVDALLLLVVVGGTVIVIIAGREFVALKATAKFMFKKFVILKCQNWFNSNFTKNLMR